ncbi:MAG: O-antigen ligase family protein [Patescibacteria group bacterium]
MQKFMQKLSGKLDEALKFGTAAIILAIPLYQKFPFISIPGTYVSVRLEDFLILTVSFIWFLKIVPNYKVFLKDRVNQAIILFLGVSLVSLISAMFLTNTVVIHLGVLNWARRVEYMLPFFIGFSAMRSKSDLWFYIKCIFIAIFFVFIFGVGQKHFNWPVITTQNREYSKGIALKYIPGGHLASTFAGHYDLAAYIIITSPILFALLFSGFAKDIKTKVFVFAFIAMSFWLLVNTVSRISVASYMLSGSIILFLVKKWKLIPVFVVAVAILGGLSMSLVARYESIIKVFIKDVSAAEPVVSPAPAPVVEDRSTSIRINVEWPRAIRALTKNPLMGTGFSSITLATDNDYLRLLGEAGIVGFLAFVIIFKRIIGLILPRLKNIDLSNIGDLYVIAIASAIPGVLLNAVFIDVFEASKFAILFWLMLGFAVSAIKNEKNPEFSK